MTTAAAQPAEATTLEEQVSLACRAVRLTPVQSEVVLLHLCDGMTVGQIRHKLHLKRVCETRELLESGLTKLALVPWFREALAQTEPPRRHVEPEEARDARDMLIVERWFRFLLQAMRGPRPSQPRPPQIGRMWTEVCHLPGAGKQSQGVAVQMSETIPLHASLY